jgi:hypothetical protein
VGPWPMGTAARMSVFSNFWAPSDVYLWNGTLLIRRGQAKSIPTHVHSASALMWPSYEFLFLIFNLFYLI